ncbi:tyrosine-type recombinase/integrase [Ornithinimicrobium avium]|uniref:Site-specific integrase n=1 Tax=Ornithinimicrobium avium TaxID=2283195 RepID=A0A345NJ09_9MICO|nr:site-specific integrase [Ornithinimicrobium avium]AXH95017.1 site-specific integrase [Ornithinimicrobium avium]
MNDARSLRRRFGQGTRMRSGRWQARFTVPLGHPSGRGGQTVTAPHTFEPTTYGKEAAGDWLRDEERRLNADGAAWVTLAELAEAERARAEREAVVTFGDYSAVWLRTRRTKNGPLQESTRRGYRIWLDKYLLPTLGHLPLDQITPTVVLRWYEDVLPHDKPKTTRECYALGSAIMRTATAADGVLAGAVNPFKIDGAGSIGGRSRARTEVIDDQDLRLIMSTIRPEWRAMVALALGCGLRFGEIIALRQSDIDLRTTPPVVRVNRAVGTGPGGRRYEKGPKSKAGARDQRMPVAVVDAVTEHLRSCGTGRDGLLFPAPDGGWLSETTFRKASGGWLAVREAVGRPIRFHDLRATGATRMAQRGAHIDEAKVFLGDSSTQAAERYVRATQSRMDELTAAAFAAVDFGTAGTR